MNGMPPEQPMERRESFIPQIGESAPQVNDSDPLFREILLVMRIKLNSDKMFFDSIKIINTLLQNILKNPGQLKYSRIRLTNEKIMKHIDSVD